MTQDQAEMQMLLLFEAMAESLIESPTTARRKAGAFWLAFFRRLKAESRLKDGLPPSIVLGEMFARTMPGRPLVWRTLELRAA